MKLREEFLLESLVKFHTAELSKRSASLRAADTERSGPGCYLGEFSSG